jgi:hypothetical protein
MTIILVFLSMLTLGSSGPGSDFDRLKTLAGEWESTSSHGTTPVTFKVTSGGSALMQTDGVGNDGMVTVYHQDGDAMLLTHYCSVGNQPRMRAQKSSDGKSITFKFLDAANLKDSSTGHMTRLVIKFQDADNVTQEWTYTAKGKDESTVFQLRRLKR